MSAERRDSISWGPMNRLAAPLLPPQPNTRNTGIFITFAVSINRSKDIFYDF